MLLEVVWVLVLIAYIAWRISRRPKYLYSENTATKVLKYGVISLTNLFFIICIVKALYFDPPADTNGLFSVMMIFFIIGYNLYAFYLIQMRKSITTEYSKIVDAFFIAFFALPIAVFLFLAYH